jgi:hypothetical protein
MRGAGRGLPLELVGGEAVGVTRRVAVALPGEADAQACAHLSTSLTRYASRSEPTRSYLSWERRPAIGRATVYGSLLRVRVSAGCRKSLM